MIHLEFENNDNFSTKISENIFNSLTSDNLHEEYQYLNLIENIIDNM